MTDNVNWVLLDVTPILEVEIFGLKYFSETRDVCLCYTKKSELILHCERYMSQVDGL